eukprot:2797850-Prymnesium_polylepis.1
MSDDEHELDFDRELKIEEDMQRELDEQQRIQRELEKKSSNWRARHSSPPPTPRPPRWWSRPQRARGSACGNNSSSYQLVPLHSSTR